MFVSMGEVRIPLDSLGHLVDVNFAPLHLAYLFGQEHDRCCLVVAIQPIKHVSVSGL